MRAPKRVAEDHFAVASRLVGVRQKASAERRLHACHAEEVRRDARAVQAKPFAPAIDHIDGCHLPTRQAFEESIFTPDAFDVGGRRRSPQVRLPGYGRHHHREFVEVREGKRLRQDRIDHAVDRSGSADPQRDREAGDGGEPGIAEQLPRGDSGYPARRRRTSPPNFPKDGFPRRLRNSACRRTDGRATGGVSVCSAVRCHAMSAMPRSGRALRQLFIDQAIFAPAIAASFARPDPDRREEDQIEREAAGSPWRR